MKLLVKPLVAVSVFSQNCLPEVFPGRLMRMPWRDGPGEKEIEKQERQKLAAHFTAHGDCCCCASARRQDPRALALLICLRQCRFRAGSRPETVYPILILRSVQPHASATPPLASFLDPFISGLANLSKEVLAFFHFVFQARPVFGRELDSSASFQPKRPDLKACVRRGKPTPAGGTSPDACTTEPKPGPSAGYEGK